MVRTTGWSGQRVGLDKRLVSTALKFSQLLLVYVNTCSVCQFIGLLIANAAASELFTPPQKDKEAESGCAKSEKVLTDETSEEEKDQESSTLAHIQNDDYVLDRVHEKTAK
ncbi:hypothetical protein JTB14_007990 [Gonioctena quinquepunctata]|nr:hypothetical protein JTB14_007990 [Gonioctena quinquepunctata]